MAHQPVLSPYRTRNEARAVGSGRYYTAKPCKRGHLSERQTSNATCCECDREAYFLSAPARCLTMREWRLKNPETSQAATRRWKAQNLEYIAEYRKGARRRATSPTPRANAYPDDFIRQLLAKQKCCCAGCGTALERYELDHIVPSAKGGSNEPDNLQILCGTCNRRKHAKDPIEWVLETSQSP